MQFQINGEKLAKMPVGGTPLGEGVSRANGINFDDEQVADVTNTKTSHTVFLWRKIIINSNTTYQSHAALRKVKKNDYAAIIDELVKGPIHQSLLNDFNPGVKLITNPKLQDGNLTLNFNEKYICKPR